MFSRRHKPFQIFILVFVAAMFFPRVLPEGMFPDGLTYASIARNMAAGQGSFWSPYFSSSFWLPFEGGEYAFYGHPTLAMGVLSLFFRLLGDHWFVEKFFNILIWGTTLWLFVRLWAIHAKEKALWWLPMYVWYLMPVVLWSYPYFILDNSMAVFSLAAAIVIIKNEKFKVKNEKWNVDNVQFLIFNYSFLIPAGLLLHLAFLTKGPVGLFPLAIPLIYWFFFQERTRFRAAVQQTLVLTLTCFGSLALWGLYEPARFFWTKYFDVQLMSSIGNNDQTGSYVWTNHFDILKNILLQILPMMGVLLIIFVFSKIKKVHFVFQKESNRLAAFYLAIALSGSLPMMISHKTSGFYLMPCLPFLAMSFGMWLEPTMISWFEQLKITPKATVLANRSLFFVAFSVGIYSFMQIGRVARERDIIHDMAILRGAIPDGAKVGVCDSMMQNFNYHAYFQRYHRWELTKLTDSTTQYFLGTEGCRSTELDSAKRIFENRDLKDLTLFRFYGRK